MDPAGAMQRRQKRGVLLTFYVYQATFNLKTSSSAPLAIASLPFFITKRVISSER